MNNDIQKMEKEYKTRSIGGQIGAVTWLAIILSMFFVKPETEEARRTMFYIGATLLAAIPVGLLINLSRLDKLFHQIDLMKQKEQSNQSR